MVATKSVVTLKFPVSSFRRVPSPYSTAQHPRSQRSYIALVDVFHLPDLDKWRGRNVRDAKLTGSVPKAIKLTLSDSPGMFVFKNRGLVINADSVDFDTTTSIVKVTLNDPTIHGLLDGGHTYKVLEEYRNSLDEGVIDEMPRDQIPFVRVELLEGFDSDQIVEIVEARNTSNQVKDQSLMELENAFEGIKNEVKDEPYANLIAYKEYEIYEGTDGKSPKPIDIREIVAILTMFDKDHYSDDSHPVVAYSQKAQCLNRFKEYPDSYQRICPLLRDILKLRDHLHLKLPEWWTDAKAGQGQGAKFGKITGVVNKPVKLFFLSEESSYAIPNSFIYPILASLRSFLKLEKIKGQSYHYVWGKSLDPFEELDNGLGVQLTEALLTNALEYRNPNKLGKSVSTWDQCYNKAHIWYLKA